jgi:hypothetical protein
MHIRPLGSSGLRGPGRPRLIPRLHLQVRLGPPRRALPVRPVRRARRLLIPARHLLIPAPHLLISARRVLLLARRGNPRLPRHLVVLAGSLLLLPRGGSPRRPFRRGYRATLRSEPFVRPSRYHPTMVGDDLSD